MQIQTSLKQKKGPLHPGPGRPVGYKSPNTVRKIAIKTLQEIMQDTSASPEARAMAASRLLDEVKA
ncbi:MAG: hypothetical protein ACXWT3_08085 [Methylococcaceae bacterium]